MNIDDIYHNLTRGCRFTNGDPWKRQVSNSTAVPTGQAAVTSQALVGTDAVSSWRRQQRVHVDGADICDPAHTFMSLSERYALHETLIENVFACGFVHPTPVQQQTIPLTLERRELMVCAPTGSGKTFAYLLPILHDILQQKSTVSRHTDTRRATNVQALIVVPSRELCRQVCMEAKRLIRASLPVRVCCLDHRLSQVSARQLAAIARCHVIVTTPRRLLSLIQEARGEAKRRLDVTHLRWLIVDECDKLFEAGARGFRHHLGAVFSACNSAQVRCGLYSATFSHDVQQWCRMYLDALVFVSVGAQNTANARVTQELVFCGTDHGKLFALRNIKHAGLSTPCLIFVQSRERARQLFLELVYDGLMVDVIHAERTQAQRDKVVRAFRRGVIWVLICTDLMARGLDFAHVQLVINYDVPSSAVAYIHRVGRTGRAGKAGRAVTFFTLDDVPHMRQIAYLVKNSGNPVPDYLLQMPKKSRTERRKLARRAIKRVDIDTTPLYDKQRARKLKKWVKTNRARAETKKQLRISSK